ncbi:MAG: methylmalonyl Co-A mutase-associated GTPase MeaB, partial [Jatrophihabitantaceae bacterium]
GEHAPESERAARELSGALRFLRGTEGGWQTPVVTCSGRDNLNMDLVWKHVTRHRDRLVERGELDVKRSRQLVEWTRALVRDRLLDRLSAPGVRETLEAAEAAVLAGEITPDQAATRILACVDALG